MTDISVQELITIKRLADVSDGRKLTHPYATIHFILDFSPELDPEPVNRINDWLKEQSDVTIDDIVKKMLQSYGIPDESLDMALEKIKQTKF